jgi:hypothetical protein
MPLLGEQDGEQTGSNQTICPSSTTALRKPELPGAIQPSPAHAAGMTGWEGPAAVNVRGHILAAAP